MKVIMQNLNKRYKNKYALRDFYAEPRQWPTPLHSGRWCCSRKSQEVCSVYSLAPPCCCWLLCSM